MANTSSASSVPDVLAPGLACVFCGINPGRVSAAAAAHFANPRNDFWRLLHDAGFTPRLFDPQEQFELLELGYGVTNAAYRTTPGSGDLRRGDFDRDVFEARIRAVAPRAVAFVGKEAYRGLYAERAELGPQLRSIGGTGLFVLPSTSPANAAVPYEDRLRWFRELRDWLEPTPREAVRALVVDADDRVLLVEFRRHVGSETWWGTAGGGIDPGESVEEALARELHEEIGLRTYELGPFLFEHIGQFPWLSTLYRQVNRTYLVRVDAHEPQANVDLEAEGVADVRWWTLAELEASDAQFAPPDFVERVRTILTQ
ncbi:MAG TPA: NUDIX domain-containing protein [Gaiellaceae bacterium]|nr:NUDIX domain-containing protein [Gaiellaceae bacterium]